MANILVVDDIAINRQFLTTLLGYAEHKVVDAADGLDAVERIKQCRPDLTLLTF